MTTIRDVAKMAQVSVATVSRVLNGSPKVSDKSREAVLEAQKKLGFYLNANARALAQRDSHTVGIIVADISDPYFGAMVRSCEEEVHKHGYNLIVGQGFHNAAREKRAIDDIITYQCRGLVVHSLAVSKEELRNYLDKIPYMVLIHRHIKGYEARCISADNYMGERIIVDELISKGHQKIAYIGSTHQIIDATERLKGYLDSLQEHGVPVNQDLIISASPSLEGGAAGAEELLKKCKAGEDFTAVACYSDVMAAGVMAKLNEHGYKIPLDVSITGFDDLYLSRCLIPPLTTVHNPVDVMAREAVSRAISLYEGKTLDPCAPVQVDLIRRSSILALS